MAHCSYVLGDVVQASVIDPRCDVNEYLEIPTGLPQLSWPAIPWVQLGPLLEAALVVVFVGHLESIAIAQALASRRRQKFDANQELIAPQRRQRRGRFDRDKPPTG